MSTEPQSYFRSLCGQPGLGKCDILDTAAFLKSQAIPGPGDFSQVAQPLVSGSLWGKRCITGRTFLLTDSLWP